MSSDSIASIVAQEILDSRGNPTIEVTITTADGLSATASVPSGASTGTHEALELRDGDMTRYNGLGVLTAVQHVNTEIAKQLKGQVVTDQTAIDKILCDLDGTSDKSRLGANAILGVSLAAARVGALVSHQPLYRYLRMIYDHELKTWELPNPMMNIINGGKHARNSLAVQEFMIVPRITRDGRFDWPETLRAGVEVFHMLGKILAEKGMNTGVGDEGGYAPDLASANQALDVVVDAIRRTAYMPGRDILLALDVAASEFYKNNLYNFENKSCNSDDMIALYQEWTKNYPLLSIEDGLAEDDWSGWNNLTIKLGYDHMLVGDDLFVTNKERLNRGLQDHIANAILIKPNQIGTLTETFDCVRLAARHGYTTIISHRSGETADSFIADLAVGVGAHYLKAGAPSRGERVAKYDRLLEISREIIN